LTSGRAHQIPGVTPRLAPSHHNGIEQSEAEIHARDAHSNATLLALLFFLWGALSLFFVPFHPFGWTNVFQAVTGGAALIYFLSHRDRPSLARSIWFCVPVLAYSLVLVPHNVLAWTALGRPMEAFVIPETAMICMAMVIPRYFWAGVALIVAFFAECGFAFLYPMSVGKADLVPVSEPQGMCAFATIGIVLLVLRERKRELTRRRIRLRADAGALEGVNPLFTSVRDELECSLRSIGHALNGDRLLYQSTMARALARLTSVARTLDPLVDGPTTVPLEREQRMLGYVAQCGALLFALMIPPLATISWVREALLGEGPSAFETWLPSVVAAFVAATWLIATTRRATERRAQRVIVFLYAVLLPVATINQLLLFQLHRPLSPFLPFKILMIMIAPITAARVRLAVPLLLLTTLFPLVLWFALDFGSRRDLIPFAEPWTLVVYFLIAIIAMVMREQRRAAAIELLHYEAETATIHRRAAMFFALRDLLNSPLQALVLGAAQIDPSDPRREPVEAAVEGLVALSRRLAAVDEPVPRGSYPASLDAERELQI
jgi:hypothetical protein